MYIAWAHCCIYSPSKLEVLLIDPTNSKFCGRISFFKKYPTSIVVIIFTCKGLTSLVESAFCGAFRRDVRSAVLHPEYFSLVLAGHLRCLVSSLSSYRRTWAIPASCLSSRNLKKGFNSKINLYMFIVLFYLLF